MVNQLSKVVDLFKLSGKKEICIVGKGGSLDQIDLDSLKNVFVININNSEQIYAGDICVFYHDWVEDYLKLHKPKCDLYLVDRNLGRLAPHIILERVYNDPENAIPTQSRFFDRNVKIEDAVLITALKLSNWLADKTKERITVYMLGFDFSIDAGYSSKLGVEDFHVEADYVRNLLETQEAYLNFILSHSENLSIDIVHVGDKPYSKLLPSQFNSYEKEGNAKLVKKTFRYADKEFNKDNRIYEVKIVAEITTNHFGDLQILKEMISAAKEAGADYIKLQKRDVESFYSIEQLEQPYESPFGKTFRHYRNGLELDELGFSMVDKWCKELGIGWFASVLDLPSYEFLKRFSPEIIKLPSTISEHKDYLKVIAKDFKNDIVLSTGMTDQKYENFVLESFTECRKLYLLQCVSSYPTKYRDANVAIVRHYHKLAQLNKKIIPGYSSHDIGSFCSVLAVGAGALMIEKHVKYGNTAWAHFDDVAIDMLTDNFRNFVQDIRKAEICMGKETKQVLQAEHHKYYKDQV